jgi:ubiquinone/menaquinone biosynthesis C-methylase UbiE
MSLRGRLLCTLFVAAVAVPAPNAWSGDAKPDDAATSHRRFDDVAHWSSVFDDPKRDEWQKPDAIVSALALPAGASVADIGAGTGYFAKRLSAAVGATGTVFVVEVEPNLVAHLRDRADKENLANVVPILGSTSDPRLPRDSVDVALFVDAWHHVDRRREYLRTLQRALRPDARIAIVEWKPGKQPVGPQEEDHKLAREQVEREMAAAGFELVAAPDQLPHQYMLLFRRPPGSN